jgi:hypothetical protein
VAGPAELGEIQAVGSVLDRQHQVLAERTLAKVAVRRARAVHTAGKAAVEEVGPSSLQTLGTLVRVLQDRVLPLR